MEGIRLLFNKVTLSLVCILMVLQLYHVYVLIVVIFIESCVTFISREQQTALMAQTQAKLMKEKQANEKVSVVRCMSCVVKPDQHHERWTKTFECSPAGPSNYSGCMLHLITNSLIPLSELT
jgi:hypothetical protein